ncbi:unnamed protein product [Allacma fusca]|uniref:Uncharacterized protein n=1 Tax=Allacma fusca TaxID=39272 RepID=A0A8J2KVI4_9HEXA|nr:unnamed protein product [Allacma fusca]
MYILHKVTSNNLHCIASPEQDTSTYVVYIRMYNYLFPYLELEQNCPCTQTAQQSVYGATANQYQILITVACSIVELPRERWNVM